MRTSLQEDFYHDAGHGGKPATPVAFFLDRGPALINHGTMRALHAALLLGLLLLPGPALAQVYRWEDEQGTIHYTNPSMSPPPSDQAPSASPQGITRISFIPGSQILVSATINGAGPVTLILDTGSDRTVVAPSALWRLGVPTGNTPRAEIKGVTGTSPVDLVWVTSVEVGDAAVGPLLIIAHDADLRQADGLLGRDFLVNFTVTIDPKEGVVTLTPN